MSDEIFQLGTILAQESDAIRYQSIRIWTVIKSI